MKKSLILIMLVSILLVGCGKESLEDKDNKTTKSTTTRITTKSTTTENTSKKTKEKSTKSTKKKTTTKSTTKSTTKAKKLGKNEYISTVDGKVHKYSFVYSDEKTCDANVKKETPYDIVYRVKPYVVLSCEEAKDQNGKSYWGIVYFEHADKNSKFYY